MGWPRRFHIRQPPGIVFGFRGEAAVSGRTSPPIQSVRTSPLGDGSAHVLEHDLLITTSATDEQLLSRTLAAACAVTGGVVAAALPRPGSARRTATQSSRPAWSRPPAPARPAAGGPPRVRRRRPAVRDHDAVQRHADRGRVAGAGAAGDRRGFAARVRPARSLKPGGGFHHLIDNRLAPYGAFVLRAALGAMFIAHAYLKFAIFTVPGFEQFLASVGTPHGPGLADHPGRALWRRRRPFRLLRAAGCRLS